ncbi:MAG: hypothetical protein COC23_01480 [Hyphomicrobiales bacterium]|nr:MAG: hypothetical protein COC23_01480 [Hyphomicrobiales bacterium]
MMHWLNWNLMSWWQRTTCVALIGTLTGITLSLIAIWLWVGTGDSRKIAVWYTLSVFPLLTVMLIGFSAKIQERVDMRGSRIHRQEET